MVASLLAAVWIVGGLVAIVLGMLKAQWLPPLLGAGALVYGLLWIRVAREGRQIRWREVLAHCRRRKSSHSG